MLPPAEHQDLAVGQEHPGALRALDVHRGQGRPIPTAQGRRPGRCGGGVAVLHRVPDVATVVVASGDDHEVTESAHLARPEHRGAEAPLHGDPVGLPDAGSGDVVDARGPERHVGDERAPRREVVHARVDVEGCGHCPGSRPELRRAVQLPGERVARRHGCGLVGVVAGSGVAASDQELVVAHGDDRGVPTIGAEDRRQPGPSLVAREQRVVDVDDLRAEESWRGEKRRAAGDKKRSEPSPRMAGTEQVPRHARRHRQVVVLELHRVALRQLRIHDRPAL